MTNQTSVDCSIIYSQLLVSNYVIKFGSTTIFGSVVLDARFSLGLEGGTFAEGILVALLAVIASVIVGAVQRTLDLHMSLVVDTSAD